MEGKQEEKKFVAIRMIVLKPEIDSEAFKDWMTKSPSFLDEMGKVFQKHGLLRITFLQGNKDARQSHERAESRADSTTAGANADFAWITYWTSKQANQTAWQTSYRPGGWYDLWKEFLRKCYPRGGATPSRPEHGPPYDYLGGAAQDSSGKKHIHYGKGAGCLVEGFEVIYDKCDWS